MFKKRFRLPPEKFRAEESFSSSLFVLKTARNKNLGPRFAIVVSKEVNKSAVERNRIKRLLGTILKDNPRDDRRDYLFIIKKEPKSSEELLGEIVKTYEAIDNRSN